MNIGTRFLSRLLILALRLPSFYVAIWALAGLADDLARGRIGLGAPLRQVILVPAARALWILCCFAPYSLLRTKSSRRLFTVPAASSALFLVFDRIVSLYYWRPDLAASIEPAWKECMGAPPSPESRMILGEPPNYDIYIFQRCSLYANDLYITAVYLTPVLGFFIFTAVQKRSETEAEQQSRRV